MEYYILDEEKIVPYLLSIDTLRDFFQTPELQVEEIGDGNLNYVYIVRAKDDSTKTLVVKQAVPYLRILGEGYPLERERMTYEIRSLLAYNEMISKHAPTVYHHDEAMSVLVMEYLGEHIIMRYGMMDGVRYPFFAEHLSDFLSQTLFKTSSLYLDSASKRALVERYNRNTQLCALTEMFVFTAPYMEHETNDINPAIKEAAEAIQTDTLFKTAMLGLKYKFMNQTDALLHGDLHTGSIMINQEETYVIDPEFAFVGPFGFDVGAVIGNLIMAWISHFERSRDEGYQEWILETIEAVLVQFEAKFLALWHDTEQSALIEKGFIDEAGLKIYKRTFMLNLFHDTLGFAGAKMARRQLGVAGVADIRALENPARARAEVKALDIAKRLVKEHQQIHTPKELISLLREMA